MLRRIIEPAAEMLFLAAGIILAVCFGFLLSFSSQRALWGMTTVQP
jgi:hypothetical protein